MILCSEECAIIGKNLCCRSCERYSICDDPCDDHPLECGVAVGDFNLCEQCGKEQEICECETTEESDKKMDYEATCESIRAMLGSVPYGESEIHEALRSAFKSVQKKVPLKPKVTPRWICPGCSREVDSKAVKCASCGQALDWSEGK